MNTRILRRIILAAFAVIALLVLVPVIKDSVGGSDRSTEAYCDAWLNYTKPKGKEYDATVDAYKKAMDNPGKSAQDKAERTKAIEDITKMFAAMPSDIAELYDTVEKVAPSEIEPDVARAAQDAHAFADQNRKVPTDPMGLGGGFLEKLLQSAASASTQQRIHNWNAANCSNLQGKDAYFN